MRIAYRGNFQFDLPEGVKPWSTESHVGLSLEELGHEVFRIQESTVDWPETLRIAEEADVFLWTSTYGFATRWAREAAEDTLTKLRGRIPSVGLHLDLWWGLHRVDQLGVEPFFKVDLMCTADGDHDNMWPTKGINHLWSPPAVYRGECFPGASRPEYESELAFIGSWRHYGHPEWWRHRRQLLVQVQRRYRGRFAFWPKVNSDAVRGKDLNDLYASVKIVIGDSCFADRSKRYFSDRAFETVGRGGFLLMPAIPALQEMLIDGEHCRYFKWGDYGELYRLIDYYLEHEDERNEIRLRGQEHVRANHTYANRLERILEIVKPDQKESYGLGDDEDPRPVDAAAS